MEVLDVSDWTFVIDDCLELFLVKGIPSMESLSLLEVLLCKLDEDEEEVVFRGTVSVRSSVFLSGDVTEPVFFAKLGEFVMSLEKLGRDFSVAALPLDLLRAVGDEGKFSLGFNGSMSDIFEIVELFLDVSDFLPTIGVRSKKDIYR